MFAHRLPSLMCFKITLGLLAIDISIVQLRIWLFLKQSDIEYS